MRELTLATNGIHLRVWLDGPDDGPPVLLLHGFPDLAVGWTSQIAALSAAGYRVIAPNQRGYPGADKPRPVSAYRMPTLVDDALGLLDMLGIERAHVVGHDWGGVVGWWLAGDHAERVLSYSALNTPHPRVLARAIRTSTQGFRLWYALAFQLPGAVPILRFGRAALVAQILKVARTGTWTDAEMQRYRTAFGEPGAMRGMIAWYRAAFRWRDLPRSARVAVRTALVWGERDPALSTALIDPTAARCDGVTVHRFPSAGHFVQRDAAAEVNAVLLAHLAR